MPCSRKCALHPHRSMTRVGPTVSALPGVGAADSTGALPQQPANACACTHMLTHMP